MQSTKVDDKMPRMFHDLELPASADFHVHLRDGAMMEAVTPTIEAGGVATVYVMVSPVGSFALASGDLWGGKN